MDAIVGNPKPAGGAEVVFQLLALGAREEEVNNGSFARDCLAVQKGERGWVRGLPGVRNWASKGCSLSEGGAS